MRIATVVAGFEGTVVQPAKLQAVLTKVTERLARELDQPTTVVPDWSEFEWSIAKAVAAMHGVSPLLSRSLRWHGPDAWMNFLEEQRAHVSQRHLRIERLLLQVDQSAREAGIAIMTLKGVALHALGLYARGERPMADVDLLVHPQDAARAVRLIESLKYKEHRKNWKERAFGPLESHSAGSLGEHANNDVSIELHERVCERLPLHLTDITQIVCPALLRSGLNGYPSRAALMIHLLLRVAGEMALQSVRLIQLHDLALVGRQMTEADWDELLEWRSSGQALWWVLPPLKLTLRYYALGVPGRALQALESQCPWVLRRNARRLIVSDVSLSHLWIDAFPGIEWSRSIREVLSYAACRIRPSPEHLAERASNVVWQDWAADNPWASLPQGRRIARWLVSRQVRPATMHVLRAALTGAP
jgi:Uncharacterised nucleotidyltransferase